jgi:hypothetical protein
MKFKASTSICYDASGDYFHPRVGDWYPLSDHMIQKIKNGASRGPCADMVAGHDLTGYSRIRLISQGDPYTAARWEVA